MELRVIINKLKYTRLNPEEKWLIEVLEKVKKYKYPKFPNLLYYKINNTYYFQYDTEIKILHYDRVIRDILIAKYGINNKIFDKILIKYIENYLKIDIFTIFPISKMNKTLQNDIFINDLIHIK